MAKKESPYCGITRRNFLKTTTVTAGVLALSGGACLTSCDSVDGRNESSESSEDQFFYGTCRGNCAGGCGLKIKVRDGVVVQTEMGEQAQEAFNRICPKGLSHPQRTYSTARVQYPMRQVGGKGSGEWERISWDEAIEEISSKWKQYQAESGNSSIIFSTATGALAVGKDLYRYVANLMGASTTAICYDGAGLSMLMKTIGYGLCGSGNNFGCERDSRVILMVGANSHMALLNNYHFLQEAQDAGATLIHIDPVYSLTSQKSDKHIPIVPGTDGALFLAMTKYCIDQGWADEKYLKKATVAPLLIKEDSGHYLKMSDLGMDLIEGDADSATGEPKYIDANLVWDPVSNQPVAADTIDDPFLEGSFTVDGIKVKTVYQGLKEHLKDWTLEKASSICDIPVEDIAEMTHLFVHEGPSTVYMGFGIDHYNGGHKTYQAIITFLAVTGQFGDFGKGLSGVSSGSNVFLGNPNLTVSDVTPGPVIGTVKLAEAKEKNAVGDIPIDIRSIFFYGHNYISNISERKKAIECLKSIDFVVVADMTMNDTTEYADIVLPVCGWMETMDLYCGGPVPIVKIQEKAIEPLYESKNDFEIAKLLAEKMGFSKRVPWEYEEYLSDFFENRLMQSLGYTFETIKKEKSLALFPETDGKCISGYGDIFPTETGKLQFYLDKYARSIGFEGMDMGDADKIDERNEQFATFEPPSEAWHENPLIEKYPLQYMSNRNRYTTHSQFFEVPWFREILPEPTLKLNPQDANERGIKSGDTVKAFNDRGYVVLKAQIDAGIRPGIVIYPKGWQASQHIEGHISDLTSSYTIPSAYNNYYFDALCEVEKVEEA